MRLLIISIAIGLGVGVYFISPLVSKQKSRHKRNQKIAKSLLRQLQKNHYEPGYIFGILRNTDPFVFEELLLLCLKNKGYRIKTNQAYTGDGGIDGTFYDKQGNKFLMQAKRYKSAITPQHVKDFSHVVTQEQAVGGFFIHTGRTGTKSYENLAENIRFISGNKLLKLLGL